MALNDREYARERYRLPERKKRQRTERVRKRLEAATPRPKGKAIEIPIPQTTAGLVLLTIAGGLAIAAVMIGVVGFIAG